MAPLCPNLSNKKVKQAFDEMKEIFGEDMAYFLWSENGGYPLDLAPNGASSILFKSLMDYYSDRKQALISKAKVYSSNFKDWFGDWTKENKTDVSKIVDENGEPLVVYRGDSVDKETFEAKPSSLNVTGIYFAGITQMVQNYVEPSFYNDYQEGKMYTVFINAKNPFIGTRMDVDDWNDGKLNEYDAWIYGNFPKGNGELVVRTSEQIKSIDNNGEFSKEGNIYHNIQDEAEYYRDAREYAEELEKKYLSINYLNLSKEHKEALKRRVIEEFSKKFKHYRIIFYYPDNKSKHLKTYVKNYDEHDLAEWGKVLFGEASTDDNYSDNYDSSEVAKMILREVRGTSIHEMLIGELIAKALKQYNITFAFSKTLGQDVAAKYEVVHGRRIIYVNTKAAFINTNNYKNRVTQTIMHEMLHAITEEAISRNDDLYKEIDKLRKQVIKELGNNAKDYGLTSVYEFMAELSNMKFVEKLKNIKTEKKITFFEWIRSIVNELARRILRFAAQNNGTAYSDAMEMLVKSAFPQEYKLPLTEPSEVVKRVYNQTTSNSTQNSYDENSYKSRIISQFSQLEKLYERMPNKSLSRQKIQDSIFEKINELRQKEEYEVVSETLKFAAAAIGSDEKIDSTLGYLYKQSKLSDPYSGITPTILIDMYRNSIKFYRNLLDNVLPSALDKHLSDDDISIYKELNTNIDSALALWKEALVVVSNKIVNEHVDDNFFGNAKQAQGMKILSEDYLHYNILRGDLNGFQTWVENASQSSNLVIKMMHNILSYAETQIQIEANKEAVDVRRAYKQANTFVKKFGPNWQSRMMEFDRDGVPTGYFVRPINYGQYKIDLDNFIKELNERFDNTPGIMHHYIIDENTGQYINSVTNQFAEDEEFDDQGNPPDIYKYLLEIEKWKCEHANRRYTFEYYKERMSKPFVIPTGDPVIDNLNKDNHGLSPRTLIKYNRIQSNINYYLDKCTGTDGITRIEELNPSDLQKYENFIKDLQNLSNPYNDDGSIKPLDQVQMAMEIRAYQSFINKDTNIKAAFDEYDAELAKITDPVKRANFIKYNTEFKINPDYMAFMPKFDNSNDDANTVFARYIRQILSNIVKYDNADTIEKDLSGKESNVHFWQMCKETDQIISDGSVSDPSLMQKFNDHFKSVLQVYRDVNGKAYHNDGTVATEQEVQNYYKENDPQVRAQYNIMTFDQYMINKYYTIAKKDGVIPGVVDQNGVLIDFNSKSDKEVYNIIYDMFTYTHNYVKNGQVYTDTRPLNIFNNLYPKKDTINGRPTVLRVPKGRFAEKHNRKYFNQNYNKADTNSEQPKAFDDKGNKLYDNSEAYNKLVNDRKLYNLYDILIDKMKSSQSDFQSKNAIFNYQLPKFEASNIAQLSRILKRNYKVKDVYDGVRDTIIGTKTSDEDFRLSDNYQYSTDNGFNTDVALRYVGQLENRRRYSFDVTGSVLMYIHMAKNYKYKKQVESQLWTLRHAMDEENRTGIFNSSKNSLKRADNLITTQLYDTSGMSPNDAKYNAIVKAFKNIGSVRILGLNLLSMNLGLVDAFRVLFRDSLVGKYLSIRDLTIGLTNAVLTLPKLILNIGQPLANCKTIAMMQRFGIATHYRDSSMQIGESRTVKILKNLLMGGFRMFDFFINVITTRAFANHCRFYDGDVVPKGFYTQYELEQAFINAGSTAIEADLNRFTTLVSLWDAYEYKNGIVTVKAKYAPYITKGVEKRFKKKCDIRGGIINGVNPNLDQSLYQKNIFGAFAGAMRGWMVQREQETLAGRDDTSVEQEELVPEYKVKNGKTVRTYVKRKFKTREQMENRLAWDFDMGMPQTEEWKGCWRAFNQSLKNLCYYFTFGNKFKDKYRHFSSTEKTACKQMFVEVAMIAILIAGIRPLFNWQSDVDDDDDFNRSGLSITDVVKEDFVSYSHFISRDVYKKMIFNAYIRVCASALEQETPICALDVIKSYTVFQQNINAWGYGSSYFMRKLYGEKGDDLVKNGSYKGFTVDQRDLLRSTMFFDALHKSLTNQGLDANTNLYMRTFLNEAFFLKALNVDLSDLAKSKKSEKSKKSHKQPKPGDEFYDPFIGGGDKGSTPGYDPTFDHPF